MIRRLLDLIPWYNFTLPADPLLSVAIVSTCVFVAAGLAVIAMVVVVPKVWPLPERK